MPSPAVRMHWDSLLFLHWRTDAARLRALIPTNLDIDTFDGSAWIGLVPFKMANCRFRGVPPLASTTNFYECNVRTYVRHRTPSGQVVRGVWFFSLDAQTLLPVLGGRWLWSLNYVRSDFAVTQQGSVTDYRLERRRGPWPAAKSHIRWRTGELLAETPPTTAPTTAPSTVSTGEHSRANTPTFTPSLTSSSTLAHFLTERYWLFTRRFGRVLGGRVAHVPWPLRAAELLHLDDTLLLAAGVQAHGTPVAFASDHLEVEGYPLGRVQPPDAGPIAGP